MTSLFDAVESRDKVLKSLAADLPAVVLEALFPDMDESKVRALIWPDYASAACNDEVAGEGIESPEPLMAKKGGSFSLYTDGASRGNPGEAGAGFVLYDSDDQEIAGEGVYLGKCTNNIAEYQALIHGIQLASQFKPEHLDLYLDSQLIVRQVLGEYKVKSQQLKPLYQQVMSLLAELVSWRIFHVRRELNKRADELANQGIDEK